MSLRRAGAPRLIEWTGERCVPWTDDVAVVYEHFHRYLWARALVAERRVLDLGSGEGFGAALLAQVARAVVGVDVDAQAVEHSRLNYGSPNLTFSLASATDLGALPDDGFDAVVAFEVIEHIADQEAVLFEVARVLAPGGLLLISTPDRLVYSKTTGQQNPFHERELTQEELVGLLGPRFSELALFGQRPATGSRIEALGSDADGRALDVRIEDGGEEWREGGAFRPLYLIAVASNSPLPELPANSSLSDFGLRLVRRVEAERDRSLGELGAARSELEATQIQLAERTRDLEGERRSAEASRRELARIEGSVTWRLLQRASERFYSVIGRESRAAGLWGAALRAIGRRMRAE